MSSSLQAGKAYRRRAKAGRIAFDTGLPKTAGFRASHRGQLEPVGHAPNTAFLFYPYSSLLVSIFFGYLHSDVGNAFRLLNRE